MTNDVKKVPELRFPEFDGEWEEDKLRDLLKDNVILEQSDGNHGELYPKSSEFTEDGIPYLAASNISNNSISYQNIKYLPLERAKQFKKGVARDGDILLAHNATVGPSVLLKTDFPFVILSTTLTLYRINKVKMDNHFFLNEIRSNNIQNQLKKLMKQTTRNQVPILLQRTMHITYPKTLAEQHKIGSFFSKLDQQIELEEKKLAKLEEQKKGYMQKIFSQELRFKDENDNYYPEWRKEIIGNIATTFSGGTPSSTNSNFYNGSIPFIRSGEIYKNSTELMINEQAISNSSAKIVKVGDLLYALYGATSGEVAISKINGAINQAVLCIRSQESVDYLFNYLKMKKDQILKTYIQGGQGNLSASIIKKIDIDLPSIEEQKKIGSFLNKLDELINKHNQKIDGLKKRKKGFLQKMFV